MRKRQFKKVLSLVLALAMVFSMNTSVFATGNVDAPVVETQTETQPETPVTNETETPAPAENPAPAAEEPAAEEPAPAADPAPAAEPAPAADPAPAAEAPTEEPAKDAEPVVEAPAAEAPVVETETEAPAGVDSVSIANLAKDGWRLTIDDPNTIDYTDGVLKFTGNAVAKLDPVQPNSANPKNKIRIDFGGNTPTVTASANLGIAYVLIDETNAKFVKTATDEAVVDGAFLYRAVSSPSATVDPDENTVTITGATKISKMVDGSDTLGLAETHVGEGGVIDIATANVYGGEILVQTGADGSAAYYWYKVPEQAAASSEPFTLNRTTTKGQLSINLASATGQKLENEMEYALSENNTGATVDVEHKIVSEIGTQGPFMFDGLKTDGTSYFLYARGVSSNKFSTEWAKIADAVNPLMDAPAYTDVVSEDSATSTTIRIKKHTKINTESGNAFIVVSGNTPDEKIADIALSDWTKINTTAEYVVTKTVSLDAAGNVEAGDFYLVPGDSYKVFVAHFTGGDIDSEIGKRASVITLPAKNELAVEWKKSATTLVYAGMNGSISDNYLAEARNQVKAKDATVKYFVADKTDATALAEILKDDPSNFPDPAKGVKEINGTTDKGLASGNYVVVAFAKVENAERAEFYKKATVSSTAINLHIIQKEVFLQPEVEKGYEVVAKKNVNNSKFSVKLVGSDGKVVEGITLDDLSKVTYHDASTGKVVVSYDSAGTYPITASANGAVLADDGDSNYNTSYKLVDNKSLKDNLNVVAFNGLTITVKNDNLYYEAAQAGSIDLTEYVTVNNGSIDVTKNKNTEIYVSVSNNKDWVTGDSFGSIPNASKVTGKKLYISANYLGDDDVKAVDITVKKQPIVIKGAKVTSKQYADIVKVFKDKTIDVEVLSSNGKTRNTHWDQGLNTWTTSTSADIIGADIIDNTIAGTYTKALNITDSMLKAAAYSGFSGTISENYTIQSASVEYEVTGRYKITVVNADDGTQKDEKYFDAGAGSVDISMNKAINPTGWYLTGDPWGKKKTSPVKGAVVSNDQIWTVNGVYDYDYYLYFTEQVPSSPNYKKAISVDAIEPVVYTGLKHVLNRWYDGSIWHNIPTNDKTNLSDDIDIKVYEYYMQGAAVHSTYTLKYNTDYTVSFKNNTNAAYANAGNKAPTIVIKGKGQYKNLKMEVPFTILPLDLENGSITPGIQKRYVKYTGSSTHTVTFAPVISNTQKGKTKKLGNKDYEVVKYYETATGKTLTPVNAKNPNKLTVGTGTTSVNYIIKGKGNYTGTVKYESLVDAKNEFYAVPSTGAFKVTNYTKSVQYSDKQKTVSPASILEKATFKVGSTSYKYSDIKDDINISFWTAKKNGSLLATDATGALTQTGKCFVKIEPKDITAMIKYNVYQETFVQFDFQGTKITKAMVTLNPAVYDYIGARQNVSMNLTTVTVSDLSVTAYNSKKDVTTAAGVDLVSTDKDGKKGYADIVSTGFDNVDPGNYYLAVTGVGKFNGTLWLQYKVQPVKVTKDMLGVSVNGKPVDKAAISFDAAGYRPHDRATDEWMNDASEVAVYVTFGKDKAPKTHINLAYTNKSDDGDYTATFTGSKVGSGYGKLVIKGNGTYFKGSVTYNLDVNPVDMSKDWTVQRENPITALTTAKTAPFNVYQVGYKYSGKGWKRVEKKLKIGKDYKLDGPTLPTTVSQSIMSINKADNAAYVASTPYKEINFYTYNEKAKSADIELSTTEDQYGYKISTLEGKDVYKYQVSLNDMHKPYPAIQPAIKSITLKTKGGDQKVVLSENGFTASYKLTKSAGNNGNGYGKCEVTITLKPDKNGKFPYGGVFKKVYTIQEDNGNTSYKGN